MWWSRVLKSLLDLEWSYLHLQICLEEDLDWVSGLGLSREYKPGRAGSLMGGVW